MGGGGNAITRVLKWEREPKESEPERSEVAKSPAAMADLEDGRRPGAKEHGQL